MKTMRVESGGGDTASWRMAEDRAARVADTAFASLDAPVRRVTGPHTPVPYSKPLEDAFVPTPEDVVATTVKLLGV